MKISDLDKRRAILRLPEFEKDYESLKALKTRTRIYQREFKLERKWGYPIDKIVNSDEVEQVPSVRPVVSIDKSPLFIVTKSDGEKEYESLAGDNLYLKVDLNQTIEKLEGDFKSIIRKYKALMKSDSNERESQILLGPSYNTIWNIYDMRHKQNKKYAQITREVFNVKGSLGSRDLNSELPQSYYNQVRYAHEKAENIIKSVCKELKLDIPKKRRK